MTSSISKPVNNIAAGIHKIKCKYKQDVKLAELNTNITTALLHSPTLKVFNGIQMIIL